MALSHDKQLIALGNSQEGFAIAYTADFFNQNCKIICKPNIVGVTNLFFNSINELYYTTNGGSADEVTKLILIKPNTGISSYNEIRKSVNNKSGI